MGKNNNKRERQLNPQPFLSDNDGHAKRSKFKAPKPKSRHQSEKADEENEELISSTMSSKILKQALAQQKEIQDEANLQNPNSALLFAQEYVTPKGAAAAADAQTDDDDDIDGFDGFSETQSRFGADDVSHSLAILKIFCFIFFGSVWLLRIRGKIQFCRRRLTKRMRECWRRFWQKMQLPNALLPILLSKNSSSKIQLLLQVHNYFGFLIASVV